MCEVTLVVGILRLVGEGQSVVAFGASTLSLSFSFEVVLGVDDVRANAVPTGAFEPRFFRAVAEHFHALVVEGVRFAQIQEVQTSLFAFESVRDFEEKPLRMPISVNVILKNEVIFAITKSHSREQISTFEAAFKNKSLIFRSFWDVVRTRWQLYSFNLTFSL